MTEFDNFSNTEANASEIERFIDEKFSKIIKVNTEKKRTSLSRNMSNEACQVNFDKMNIKTCLQNKKLPEEITFLREQINEKKTIIFRSLFSLKLSNREEDNFP